MKKIITATGNIELFNELENNDQIKLVCNDIIYKEGIIEKLEEDNNIDFIIINEIIPIPIIFIISSIHSSYILNKVLTVLNKLLISLITSVRTITTPARVVIIACSSLPALHKT